MSALTRFEADQCTVVFLDHTPSLFPVHSIEPLKLENNVLGLAKVARALGMPVVISTIQSREAGLADPLFEKLTRFIYADVVLDEDDVIERTTKRAFSSRCRRDGRADGNQEAHHVRPLDRDKSSAIGDDRTKPPARRRVCRGLLRWSQRTIASGCDP